MAHAHESNLKRIWTVFGILSVVTTVEVILGIIKPEVLFFTEVFSLNLLNWIFIILTVLKAYYIMCAFMHLEAEKKSFTWSIIGPLLLFIPYISFIFLEEAVYIFNILNTGHYKWVF